MTVHVERTAQATSAQIGGKKAPSVDLLWPRGLRTELLLPLVRSHRILKLLALGGRSLALLRLPFALLRLGLVLERL